MQLFTTLKNLNNVFSINLDVHVKKSLVDFEDLFKNYFIKSLVKLSTW